MTPARLSHRQLYEAVCDGTFPASEFSHEEHARLAWYYLTHWPFEEACERFERDFRLYVQTVGAASKYHHTVTHALLRLIHSHLDRPETRTDWNTFKDDAEPLFTDGLELLERFYTKERLFSETAKNGWLPPDRSPLP